MADRRCEGCGGAMPRRMHRQRDRIGRLVCDSCKSNGLGEWNVTYASKQMPPEFVREFKAREVAALASLRRRLTMSTVAHDSGDGETIYHCPFCGSGAVVGSPQGTVACSFCHSRFTVQVQPEFSSMPQTVDGQPYNIPGMPGGGPDAGAERVEEAQSQAEVQNGQPEEPEEPEEVEEVKGQPFQAMLLTAEGVALPLGKYLQRLALEHADDREAVLAQVRTENGAAR